MNRVRCLAPITDSQARLLILGSMPGVASLNAGQYYAHPQNSFWKIMAELFGFDRQLAYLQRVEILQIVGIAVWDVIGTCHRQGSADANIDQQSLEMNDFQRFFDSYPTIQSVFFNGQQAETCYQRYVMPSLNIGPLNYRRLPSTSPANASQSYLQKLAAWQQVADILTSAN